MNHYLTVGNEPANPTIEYDGNGGTIQGFGLTKREQFAMAAMQGLLSMNDGAMNSFCSRVFSPDSISELAVLHGDALIAALNKEVPGE